MVIRNHGTALVDRGSRYYAGMEAFWLLLIPVALVGGYFLIRSFIRLSKSIGELRTAMTDLADAGLALNEVQAEVARLGDSLDEVRRQ